eukprot:Lankesteria_metandrocarpae@DN2101_c0_g1_i1.p1
MSVTAFWNGSRVTSGREFQQSVLASSASDSSYDRDDTLEWRLPSREHEIMCSNIAINSTAHLEEDTSVGVVGTRSTYKVVGSATEGALLCFLQETWRKDYEEIRRTEGAPEEIIHVEPFSSDRKISTAVVKSPVGHGLYRVYVKGAAEIVLRLCTSRIAANRKVEPMSTNQVDRINVNVVEQLASMGLRTICLAFKDFDPVMFPDWRSAIEQDARVGLTGTGATGASPLRLPLQHPNGSVGRYLSTAGTASPPGYQQRLYSNHSEVVVGGNLSTPREVSLDLESASPRRTSGIGGHTGGSDQHTNMNNVASSSYRTQRRISKYIFPNKGLQRLYSSPVAGQQHLFSLNSMAATGSATGSPNNTASGAAARLPLSQTYYWMETQLTCLCVFGLEDPLRLEVPSAVLRCQSAGVSVKMVTGDNIETAKRIALACNIMVNEHQRSLCMLGNDFYREIGGVVCEHCLTEQCPCPVEVAKAVALGVPARRDVLGNPEAFDLIADDLCVLARSQPRDKYALVTGLKNRGAVVAVTGDGANDAPALRKADVGFAMGLTGKEVAKEAADIILLDDNFGSIVKAIRWGRCIYDNIRRFLQFQLTVNIVAVVLAVIGAIVLRESPLTTVQLLWVNLIMDSLGSLALATEPPTEDLLDRKPHSRTDYLISKTMWRNILGQAVYQLSVLLPLLFAGERYIPETEWTYLTTEDRNEVHGFTEYSLYGTGTNRVRSGRHFHPFSNDEDYQANWDITIGPSRHYTVLFNTFVMMQIFNLLNARKINNESSVFSGIFKNYMWWLIAALVMTGQILLVEVGGRPLNCHLEGLTVVQWAICVSFGVCAVLVRTALQLLPTQLLPEFGRREENPEDTSSVALALKGRSFDRLATRMSVGLQSHRRSIHASDDEILVKKRAARLQMESLKLNRAFAGDRFKPRMFRLTNNQQSSAHNNSNSTNTTPGVTAGTGGISSPTGGISSPTGGISSP